jgi:hypothetical protein
MNVPGGIGTREERDFTELSPIELNSHHNMLVKKFNDEKENFEFVSSELTLEDIKLIQSEIKRRKELMEKNQGGLYPVEVVQTTSKKCRSCQEYKPDCIPIYSEKEVNKIEYRLCPECYDTTFGMKNSDED